MKRVLFFMLTAGLLMSATAQENVFSFTKSEKIVLHEKGRFDLEIPTTSMLPTNPKGSLVDVGGWKYAGTSESYDRQTQGAVYPMTKQHDDGFIGATWTNEDNPPFQGSSTPTGGVAYTYSTDGGMTWSTPDLRVGGIPLYFPSYTQWGAHGEAILARSADSFEYNGVQILNGLVLLTRENRGVDEWNIAIVPYPEGTSPDDNYVMAYARMTTSGSNHQYIHIMSPMDATVQPYEGYSYPVFYYRTQDGGLTWDIQGLLVPEMVGQEWDVHSEYIDAITFADTHGDMVACAFIAFGNDGYVLRSHDNGDTWACIKFFDSPVGPYISPSEYADTCYIPTQGCIALDNNGKIHVAFGVAAATNSEQEGEITYFSSLTTSFLSYWNEYMATFDGDDYIAKDMEELIWNKFLDEELSTLKKLYVKSTTPMCPIIGFYTPIFDNNLFAVNIEIFESWVGKSYNVAGMFSFPQMAFDANNTLHLVYLGVLDGGGDDGRWLRHPFYTTRSEDGIWSQTKYLVNTINLVDFEFAYLTSAGIGDEQWYLMVQVDAHAGIHVGDGDHDPTTNYYYYIGPFPSPCKSVTNASATITNCESATITWTAVIEAVGYIILRDGNYLATVTTPLTYTEIAEFEHGVTYVWEIRTICSYGSVSPPATVTATANCEGINELVNSVAIYPNPTTGQLRITNYGLRIENVEIFDVMGRTVGAHQFLSFGGAGVVNNGRPVETLRATSLQSTTINISVLPAGVYFVRIQTENGVVTKKVVKR